MATKQTSKTVELLDDEVLAARLRQARLDCGLTLLAVQDLTGGTVRASALSAYELGDTRVPAHRLAVLARLYEVSVEDLLSPKGGGVAAPVRRVPPRPANKVVHFDLNQLAKTKSPEAEVTVRFVTAIRRKRSASAGRYFAMRSGDFEAIAICMDISVEELLAALQRANVFRPPRGRPLGRRV